jgi:hypothetical protein
MAGGGEVRKPAVAGTFYRGTRDALTRQIEECYLSQLGPGALPTVAEDGPREVVGLVSPHAGYVYSGATASVGYGRLAADGRPDVVVVIGPSHRPFLNKPAAVQVAGGWETPLGVAKIASDVAQAIREGYADFGEGADYFFDEHSVEVQVPFLQHLYGDGLSFVPVLMVTQSAEVAAGVGKAVAGGLQGRRAVIVASTDFSHYVSHTMARQQDEALLETIVAMDPEGLMAMAQEPRMSMCGYAAVAAMLHAATALGATRAEVLAYSNSGMVEPMTRVVGYASAAVLR